MPFTPFHFGPGAVSKAAVPRHFSLSVFCFAQVVTDVEVLVYMARGGERLHGFCHTYLGAIAVGLFSVVVGWPLCQRLLRWWNSQPNLPLKEYYGNFSEIRFVPATIGAFVGSFSHVFLDSIMHVDLRPFMPLSDHNKMFGWLGPGALHLICFIFGVLGVFVCARFRKAKL